MMKKQMTKPYDAQSDRDEKRDEKDNDIDAVERDLLNKAGEDDEERALHRAELDDRDADGEPLNEKTSATDISGGDLDVPGSELDDEDEELGEEDEENNSYSLSDNKD